MVAPTKTRLSTCYLAQTVLTPIRPALQTTLQIGRTALTPTMVALAAAPGLPKRPSPSLHASLAPPLTLPALPTIPLTGRAASIPTTPALMAAHGLSTTRSLHFQPSLDANSSDSINF